MDGCIVRIMADETPRVTGNFVPLCAGSGTLALGSIDAQNKTKRDRWPRICTHGDYYGYARNRKNSSDGMMQSLDLLMHGCLGLTRYRPNREWGS